MDIISEPTYEIEDVVEWRFGTPLADYAFIIHPTTEDSVDFTESSVIVNTHAPWNPRETIVFNLDKLLWYSQMPRKIKRKVEATSTTVEPTAPGGTV